MNFVYAILMGLFQGLTEFLPVSSSGHLVLLQQFFGLEELGLGFNIILHIGTLLAVIIYYNKDIYIILREVYLFPREIIVTRGKIDIKANEHRLLLVMMIIAVIPTAAIGFSFNEIFEKMFRSSEFVGYTLIITGLILWISSYLPAGSKNTINMSIRDAVFVGLIQGASITPGISRSGSTIFAGLAVGFTKELATRFSFLLSIPAILAAVVLESREIVSELTMLSSVWTVLIGFIASAVSGYIAIGILIDIVKKQKLVYFSYYCWFVGLLSIMYHWIVL